MTDTTAALPRAAVRRRRANPLRSAFGGSGALWLLVPPVVFLVVLLVVPLAFLVDLAVRDSGFSDALGNDIFRDSMVRTLVMATTVSVLALVVGTLYALALAVAPKWMSVLLAIALFSLFWTSVLVRSYGWMLLYLPKGPLYDVLHSAGLRDEPLDVFQTTIAPYPAMVHVMLPYVVLPVYAAIRQLDPTHLRAARVLGAGPILTMRKVVLPQLRAGIMAGAVLVFVMSLGFYVTPQMLGDPSKPTVAGIIGWSFNVPGELPAAAAMSLILLAVVVIVYVVADKLFHVSEQWGRS